MCLIQGFSSQYPAFSQNFEADTNRGVITGTEGSLSVHQDEQMDALLNRYMTVQKKRKGMPGHRIQIYFGSGRSARGDAYEAKAKFLSDFPDIPAYVLYQSPFYKVRIGDFRTKREAYNVLLKLKRRFPNAYITPIETINLPPLK